MALPPLASVSDLADWLDETIADDDKRAAAVLSAASSLVRAYTEADFIDADGEADVPDAVQTVTVTVAGRAWKRAPDDVKNRYEQAGPWQQSFTYGGDGGGLYLTKTDKLLLRAYRGGVQSGIGVISTTRADRYDGTVYVPVEGTTAQFPWYDASDPYASL